MIAADKMFEKKIANGNAILFLSLSCDAVFDDFDKRKTIIVDQPITTIYPVIRVSGDRSYFVAIRVIEKKNYDSMEKNGKLEIGGFEKEENFIDDLSLSEFKRKYPLNNDNQKKSGFVSKEGGDFWRAGPMYVDCFGHDYLEIELKERFSFYRKSADNGGFVEISSANNLVVKKGESGFLEVAKKLSFEEKESGDGEAIYVKSDYSKNHGINLFNRIQTEKCEKELDYKQFIDQITEPHILKIYFRYCDRNNTI